jgi:CheY-like chemotaxis protein
LARKILLADDSVTAQNMGRKILADAGYEVITVNNGSAALKKIAEQKPDLIILDVYMPGYSGLEVCSRLKDAGETSRVPVLLTVGKLEPFKPEEAKRVRADGYIVKPFEASELLGALAKLEDKIVPRSELAKPGRLARAIAAVEDSSRPQNQGSDADTGWKNRIAFPHQKTEKPEAEDGDNPAIYNAMNRDLRTVVDPHPEPHKPALVQETHPAHPKEAAKAQEERVDLGAIAAPGFPKDVTPEEIAALAAAAAQVEATIAASKRSFEPAVENQNAAAQIESNTQPGVEQPHAQATSEFKVVEPNSSDSTTNVELKKAEPEIGQQLEAASANKPEAPKPEAKPEAEFEAKTEEPHPLLPIATDADVAAAIAALESEKGTFWESSRSGNGGWHSSLGQPSQGPESGTLASLAHSFPEPSDIPVTMAVTADVMNNTAVARWSAVPVGIEPTEAAISLEFEMRQFCAASAAAELVHSGFVTSVPEIEIPAESSVQQISSNPHENVLENVAETAKAEESLPEPKAEAVQVAPSPEPAPPVVEAGQPELGQPELNQSESNQPAPISSAQIEPESIHAANVPENVSEPESCETAEVSNFAAPETESHVPDISATDLVAEAITPSPAAQTEAQTVGQPEEAIQPQADAPVIEPQVQVPAAEVQETGALETQAPAIEAQSLATPEVGPSSAEPVEPEAKTSAEPLAQQESPSILETPEAVIEEVRSAVVPEPQFAEAPHAVHEIPAPPGEPSAGDALDMAEKKESELAATTAAAWASWRQIRETSSHPQVSPQQSAVPAKSQDLAKTESSNSDAEREAKTFEVRPPAAEPAAMAVAAGAESAPEDHSASPAAPSAVDPSAVASIVDSMLAEMRPKIMEEITRKLAAEKK